MILELPIELELKKLGLKDKEVKVYLAGLELGPNSIKNIAEKVKIPRPTVYEIVKRLKEKELFVETKKKEKKAFCRSITKPNFKNSKNQKKRD